MRENKKRVSKISTALMKKLSVIVIFLFAWLISYDNYADAALLFNVTATGAPNNANITLCLNGKGPFSCQNYTVSALNLTITTNVPNHVYPFAGIKINSPHTLANLGVDCTPSSNGYCLFSVSSTNPQTITLFPLVGASYGGGVVACLGGAPYMNLIAAINDSVNGIPWGGFGTVTGAQSTVDGASNSNLIIGAGVTNSAVNLCSGTINGYNDWFLPAKEQLNCLYTNQTAITGFMNAVYWSSTESDDNHAWFQFFDNGNQLSIFKTFYNSVRCVRAIPPF